MKRRKDDRDGWRFNIYIRTPVDQALMRRAKERAARERRSLNAWVLFAIEDALKRGKK